MLGPLAMLVIACGPSIEHASGDGSGSSTSSTSSTTSSDDGATTTTPGADESSSTTGSTLDCEAETPGCPEGCRNVSAHHATWDDPHVGLAEDLCVAAGPPVDPESRCVPLSLRARHLSRRSRRRAVARVRRRPAVSAELALDYIANETVDWVLLVEPDGSVRATFDEVLNIACTPAIWQPARICQLADPQVFDDCIAANDSCVQPCTPDLSTLEGWLVDCVDAPASCL
jgi:hypothetical protein